MHSSFIPVQVVSSTQERRCLLAGLWSGNSEGYIVMMQERLHDTATGPLRGTACGSYAAPGDPSPPCPPAAAAGGLQGPASGGGGPAEGNTVLEVGAACRAARGQSSPEHDGDGGNGGRAAPAVPQALADAAMPAGLGLPSAAAPGAAGARVSIPPAHAAVQGTESAAAACGKESAAAQAGAAAPAASAAGSLGRASPIGPAGVKPAAVPGLGMGQGQGQGWGGNLRALGGSPKTSRTATLGEIAPPLRKFSRVHSPTVPPARQRVPGFAAETVEAGTQQLLGQPGAQAAAEGVLDDAVLPERHCAFEAAAEDMIGRVGLPVRQSGAEAAAEGKGNAGPLAGQLETTARADGVEVGAMQPAGQPQAAAAVEGAVGAEASWEDMPLQSSVQVLSSGQPRAEAAAASAVGLPMGQEGAPTDSGAARAAARTAAEQQDSVADLGALQAPPAGFDMLPLGHSGSAAAQVAKAAPSAEIVPGSEYPVGFRPGTRARADSADGRAAPGSGFDACSGGKQGQQGLRLFEACKAKHSQAHSPPHQAPVGLARGSCAGGSATGLARGNPGPPGPAGAPRGACGRRVGREAGATGAYSAPGGRGAGPLGAHSALHVSGAGLAGNHGTPGDRGARLTGAHGARGGSGGLVPAGGHVRAPMRACGPHSGPNAWADPPGGGHACCAVRAPGSALCMAGGQNPTPDPVTNANTRARLCPGGGVPQCAQQGRAHGSAPFPLQVEPACRWPAGQRRPGTAPGGAFSDRGEGCPGGLAPCHNPEPAAVGAGRRGGAPVTFAEADIDASELFPGPLPSQRPRQHSAPVGGRPRAHPGAQGHAQARPPVAQPRLGAAGARGMRAGHRGPYPGPDPAPHSSWMCPAPAAELARVLPSEDRDAHGAQPELGMPRAPCKEQERAAPCAPVLPMPPLHALRAMEELAGLKPQGLGPQGSPGCAAAGTPAPRSMHGRPGAWQPAAGRGPAAEPRSAGHGAGTRRSTGNCMAEARALEKRALPACPAKRACTKAPGDGMSAAAVAPAREARRVCRGAPGAGMVAADAQALRAHEAKRACSRTGDSGMPAAALRAAAAHQAGQTSFRASGARIANAAGRAPAAQEAKHACARPGDAAGAAAGVDAAPVPRAKRVCSGPEPPGPGASAWQHLKRTAGGGEAAAGARGHAGEPDHAGQPHEPLPGVSPTFARLVEQVLLPFAEETGVLRVLHVMSCYMVSACTQSNPSFLRLCRCLY